METFPLACSPITLNGKHIFYQHGEKKANKVVCWHPNECLTIDATSGVQPRLFLEITQRHKVLVSRVYHAEINNPEIGVMGQRAQRC